MKWLRVVGVVVGLLLLCVSAVVGVVGGSRLAVSELDQSLTARSLETASTIEEYFQRARAIDLMLANTPTLKHRFEDHAVGSEEHSDSGGRSLGRDRDVEDVLGYIERLYPNRIGEVCLIDRHGVELARVVRGEPAAHDELSHEEGDNDFFQATFDLQPGQVHQATPYVSPDTGEWVISNSTQVITGANKAPGIAHFEITVDSFRAQAERRASNVAVMIVDRNSGRILTETGHPQRSGAPLGRPATELTRRIADSGGGSGVISVDGQRAAYQAVRSAPGNQNDWLVVASTPDSAAPWSTGPGKGALAAAVGALVLLGSSITGVRANQRQLRHRASTDALTGLANRTVLHARLEEGLGRGGRHHRSVLLLIDLDGFKEVNDTLGHSRGDVLLREVAQRIRHELRDTDLAARLGGDEFALLVEDLDGGSQGIEAIVDRVLTAIRRPYSLDGVGVHVDASIGIAILHEHGDTPELLIQRADVAMYQAKAAGAGYVVYDSNNDPHSARRLGLTAGLLEAIEQRQITLHYQPKLDLRTGDVVGVEALVRWTHPTLGPLSPAEFIPLAEKTGLIRPLTEAVIDEALAQCRRWLDEGRHIPVAVNCSAVDLVDDRLVELVAQSLARYDLNASMLQLEITESAIMADPARASVVLNHLADMGVGLAIDDYGTGYASLTYLKRLPVSVLKIDREFVAGVNEGSADALIVRSTIELGHSLGMQIVAEGVEDERVLDYLKASDCDSAQGYHITRPMPATDFSNWLDRHPMHPPAAALL